MKGPSSLPSDPEGAAGARAARASMRCLMGVPVGIAFSIVWSTIVRTSPTVADDKRVRGWGTVLRDLPATVVLLGVVAAGMSLAVRAGRQGAVSRARRAIWFHGAALLLVLLIIMNGATENIMTTRPSTVKWVLFPVQLGLTAGAVFLARRAVKAGRPCRR